MGKNSKIIHFSINYGFFYIVNRLLSQDGTIDGIL